MIIFTGKSKFKPKGLIQLTGLITLVVVGLLSISVIFSDNKLIVLQLVRKSVSEITYVIFGNQNHSVSSVGDFVKHLKGAVKGLLSDDDYPKVDLQIDYKNIIQLESTKYSKKRSYVNSKFIVNKNGDTEYLRAKVRYKGDRGIHVENFQK